MKIKLDKKSLRRIRDNALNYIKENNPEPWMEQELFISEAWSQAVMAELNILNVANIQFNKKEQTDIGSLEDN